MMLVLPVFSLSGRDHSLKEEIQHRGKICRIRLKNGRCGIIWASVGSSKSHKQQQSATDFMQAGQFLAWPAIAFF
jgi:hypothetical protein